MDTNINPNQTEEEDQPLPLLSDLPFAQFFQKTNLDTIDDKVNGFFSRWWTKRGSCAKFGIFFALWVFIGNIFSNPNTVMGQWIMLLSTLSMGMAGGCFFYWLRFKKKEAKRIIAKINQLSNEDKIIIRRALSIMMLIDIHQGQRQKDYDFYYPEYFLELAQKDNFNLGHNGFDIDLIDKLSSENSISDFLQKEAYQQLSDTDILQMIYSYLPKQLEDKISQYQKGKQDKQHNQLSSKDSIIQDKPENFKNYL